LDFALLTYDLFVAVLVMADRGRFTSLRKLVLIVSLLIDSILFLELVNSDNLAHLVPTILVNNFSEATSNYLSKVIIWMA
jgi:hypothetical protein